MKYIINKTYNRETGLSEPWYVGKDMIGGRLIDLYDLERNGKAWYLGFAYKDYPLRAKAFYPYPLNYVVRLWLNCWGGMIHIFYWIGLIDVGCNEEFYWGAFWRIKRRQ